MRYLIILLLLITPFISFAQGKEAYLNGKFGIRAGVNYSTLNANAITGPGTEIGFSPGPTGGFYYQAKINRTTSFQPELVFSMEGSKNTYKMSTGEILVKTNLHLYYISIPVIFKFFLNPSLHILAGPQLGFLAKATETGTQYQYSLTNSGKLQYMGQSPVNSDVTQLFKAKELLAVIGLGYNFAFGLNIALRYNFGLTNINKDPFNTHGQTISNRVLQLSLGYSFSSNKTESKK